MIDYADWDRRWIIQQLDFVVWPMLESKFDAENDFGTVVNYEEGHWNERFCLETGHAIHVLGGLKKLPIFAYRCHYGALHSYINYRRFQ